MKMKSVLFVLLFITTFSYSQENESFRTLESGRNRGIVKAEKFDIRATLTYRKAASCNCIKTGYYRYRRSRACKKLFSAHRVELENLLDSNIYSDFDKYHIYDQLFRLSKYFHTTNAHLLDSSITFLHKHVNQGEYTDLYHRLGYQKTHLFLSISEIHWILREQNKRKYDQLRRGYQNSLTPSFCSEANVGKYENYEVQISKLLYDEGCYRFAYEYLNSLGLSSISGDFQSGYKRIEQEKMLYYLKVLMEVFDKDTLEEMRIEAINKVEIRYTYSTAYGYTLFGNHIIQIPLDVSDSTNSLSCIELEDLAREKLLASIVFKEPF